MSRTDEILEEQRKRDLLTAENKNEVEAIEPVAESNSEQA
jgi:hypothetical protein